MVNVDNTGEKCPAEMEPDERQDISTKSMAIRCPTDWCNRQEVLTAGVRKREATHGCVHSVEQEKWLTATGRAARHARRHAPAPLPLPAPQTG
eukprot:4070784-Pleurochrysis_carterae.AAC.2